MITGEATPSYLSKMYVAEKIQKLIPKCKIIIILRNPIERSFSHYMMRKRLGREKRSFEHAIKSEIDGTTKTPKLYYLQRSIYFPQIKRYYDIFNQNQILILNFNELKHNPQNFIKKCYQFLELEEYEPNITKDKKKYYEILTPEMKLYLQDYFKPYNKQLYNLLGRNFGWEEQ